MSEYTPPSEQEASEAAIALANEYRERQRAEAEKHREVEISETEEDFLERVRTVSETSASGFSAIYARPVEEIVVDVESKIEQGAQTGLVASTSAGEVKLEDLVEPVAGSRALFGQEDANASEQARSGIDAQNEEAGSEGDTEDTPRPDGDQAPEGQGTEVESNGNATIVDTGYTDPAQIETAQSVVNAQQDAEAEENGEPKPSLGTQGAVDHVDEGDSDTDEVESGELSYQDKFKAIKEAKTTDEIDRIVKDDERKPLLNAAEKRKKELES